MKRIPIPFFLCFALPAAARDFRPASYFENIPLGDSSVQQCYVFQTTAGVEYRVESSNDLVHWTTQEELYGLGNEYAVTIREFTPPPPLPPGTPPAVTPGPARNTSLLFRRSSGPSGGTVISWRSLDHGGPVVVRIAGEMAAGWSSMPHYVERFDAWYFFISHAGDSASPPAENPPLGPNDTAMLAVLEASLPSMNQKVTDSVAAARNAPPPAPQDPDSKKFWRVHVNPDIDTDLDGSPDWAEFEIAARGTGMLVSGVSGNAFDADTNGDGIPDGDQLDVDLDGAPDSKDIGLSNPGATYEIGPLPRYALFPITNAEPPEGWEEPFQINDRGTVLYANGIWSGGVWKDLALESGDLKLCSARAINDHDVILGGGRKEVNTQVGGLRTKTPACYWASPDATPQDISLGNLHPGAGYDMMSGLLRYGTILSNDGAFLMPTASFNDPDFIYEHPGAWKLPANNAPATETSASDGLRFSGENGAKWGFQVPQPNAQGEIDWSQPLKGQIEVSGLSISPKWYVRNLAQPPGGVAVAMSFYSDVSTEVWYDGGWHENGPYANAIDMASDGTAIGQSYGDANAPIYLNGKWTNIERAAPEIPTAWHDASTELLDTTPSGWILASRGLDSEREHAVALPLRAKGLYVQEFLTGITTTKYVGVDDFSIGSDAPGEAVKDRIWIMAPLEGPSKTVIFTSPVNEEHPLTLSAENIDFGNVGGTGSISTSPSSVTLHAKEEASSGADIPVTLKFGELTSLSKPLGVKVMKARTVKVTMYKVNKLATGHPPNTPDQVPNPDILEQYLNDVFSPQINVRFEVTLVPTPLVLNWDQPSGDPKHHSDALDGGRFVPSVEEEAIRSARPENGPDTDIELYLIGTNKFIDGTAWATSLRKEPGFSFPGQVNASWVIGDALDGRTDGKLLQTIAHEMGHVLIGQGHPGDTKSGVGPAPLPGTNNTERLMVGGTDYNILRGSMIVKKEWDEAEKWLVPNIDGKEPQ